MANETDIQPDTQPGRPAFQRFLTCGLILFYFYKSLDATTPDFLDDFLLCRQCGHEVARASALTPTPSPRAKHQRNDTILGVPGVLIQLFVNPQGTQFEVITAKDADVYKEDLVVPVFSWFPGFHWRIAKCPRCGFQLGWAFQPDDHVPGVGESEKSFVGLILENLIHKDYADSLLMMPKFYNR